MSKKLLCLFIVFVLIFAETSSFGTVMAGSEERVLVVDSANTGAVAESGLAISKVHTGTRPYSMRWSGAALTYPVRLSCKKDWSFGSYLEFWLYSAAKTNMSFDLILVSDNTETEALDYYSYNVSVSSKGGMLISVPFESFEAVNSPLGFECIDSVELWPETKNTDAELYFDGMYVTNTPSAAESDESEVILYDLTSAASIAEALRDTGLANITVAQAPGKSGAALKWTDQPKGAWLRFKNLPVTDMNSYNTMEISLYSGKISRDTVRFVCASDNEETSSRDYFHSNLVLDWEGEWRTIRLRVGESGNMSNAGVPLGWNNLTGLEFWYNVDDVSAPSEVYIDKITLKNVDYSYQWEEEQFLDDAPLVEDYYDFAAKINERFPNHEHPRLVATQEHIDFIKREKDSDEYLRRAVPKLLSTCDTYAEIVDTNADTITTSTRAATLALGYVLTEKQEYKDALWEKMKLLSTDCISWTPSGTSSLSAGDTARYVGITYDLMYKYWTEEERKIVRNAIVLYGLEPLRSTVLSGKGLALQEDNWNAVIFSGLAVASLAIADAEGYAESANQILNRVPNFFQHCFKHYAPDGAGFEGTNYWHYAMLGQLPYEASLCHSIGEEDYQRFTILNDFGLDKTGYFMLNMVGDTLVDFNFYDGHEHIITSSADFWLARYFNKPEFGGYLYEIANDEPWSILIYRPDERYKNWRETMETDYHADGSTQVGAMRTSFVEKNGFYVGYKGGQNLSASHGRLDIGSFVLESMGQRWVKMIPSESYTAPEMFGHLRYSYYGNRAEGANTLVIAPEVDQSPDMNEGYSVDQTKDAYCKIIKTKSSPTASYAIVDMTEAYRESAESVQRGFGLIADKNAFLLQDEIKVKKGTDVYSFMHTTADVEISGDGKSAIMSLGGKKMKARLLSPKNGKFSMMDAVPLPTSPEAQNLNRDTYKKLTVKTRIDSSETIAVLFTPYYGEDVYEYSLNGIKKLSDWDAFTTGEEINPEITGDSGIYRAPVGTTQLIKYKTDMELVNGTEWSLKNAPKGVTIDQNGVLKASGNILAGEFEVQLLYSGKVIASKTVTIYSQPEKYIKTVTSGRYFEDFTRYKDNQITTGSYHGDIKLSSGIAATTEENRNVYAKASLSDGAGWGSSQTALKLIHSWNDGNVYMSDASVVSIEGSFMAEMPTNGTRWPVMWHNALGINISYELSENGSYAKLIYTDESESPSTSETIGFVERGKWFNFRLELDYINDSYSAFLEDNCVVENKKFKTGGIRLNKDLVIGASVDNLAMYNGTKYVRNINSQLTLKKDGVEWGSAGIKNYLNSAESTVISAGGVIENLSEGSIKAGLFLGIYGEDDGLELLDYDVKEAETGKTEELYAEINADADKNKYVKVFVWDMENLCPIN